MKDSKEGPGISLWMFICKEWEAFHARNYY